MGNLPVRSVAVHSDLCNVRTFVSGESDVEDRRTDRRRETGKARGEGTDGESDRTPSS